MSIFGNKSIVVRRVFAEDSDSELLMIKEAILTYHFLSIDIEFPGTIFKPSKQVIREGNPVINYHYMKSNVDVLQIIQLGLSLSDAQGNLLDFDFPFSYIWEFNFRDFNINRDHYASDSIELFKHQGIDFEKNKEKGIDSKDFAKKFWDYGLVFNSYGLKSSLEKIAQTLNAACITGSSHQAGSDNLFTLQCFMKFKSENIFESKWNETNQMLLFPLTLYGLVKTIR
ncbi:hypothetical protein ES288_D10G308200v1 [Gossypium darwinii]|uniref:poly(A)-specific ribonuclease n=1 Tax=Gossypium darwinii TaxID=34276 RepID=A0A5D2B3T8_GOSDA|nr:hypothetical protein ES288_D10G308200v1 [Gossypium darwinii]